MIIVDIYLIQYKIESNLVDKFLDVGQRILTSQDSLNVLKLMTELLLESVNNSAILKFDLLNFESVSMTFVVPDNYQQQNKYLILTMIYSEAMLVPLIII